MFSYSFILAIAHATVFMVAVWVGVSRRWWFARAIAILSCLAALFAVRAYQPMVWCSLAMPIVVWSSRMILSRSPAWRQDEQSERSSIRFGLRDALLSMLLLGVYFAMLSVILRTSISWEWELGVWTLICILFVGLCLVTAASRGSRRIASILYLLAAAWITSTFGDWIFQESTTIHYFMQTTLLAVVHSIVPSFFFWFPAMVFATLHLWKVAVSPTPSTKWGRRLRLACRIALPIWLVVLLVPGLMIYVNMLKGAPIPAEPYVSDSSSDEWIQKVAEIAKLNPDEVTIGSLVRTDQKKAASLKRLHDELMTLLESPQHITIDWKEVDDDSFDRDILPLLQEVRSIGRTFDQEAEDAAKGGKPDEAARYNLAALRLADSMQHGGVVTHQLVGIAVEGVGTSRLVDRVNDTSPKTAKSLLKSLVKIDAAREERQLTDQRDLAFTDRTERWLHRLSTANRSHFREEESSYESGMNWTINRRDAFLRLLICELAIRLYRKEHGELPQSLEALCPKFLVAVPIDPFSGKPLLYLRTETGMVVYSVGKDQEDNGGRLGNWSEVVDKGFDLDLRMGDR